MWRILSLLAAVLILDFVFFWVGWGDFDANMVEISRAIEAREKNFSRETQKAVDDAFIRGESLQLPSKVGFGAAIIVVTVTGFFVAGRWFERYRNKPAAVSAAGATQHT